jgi:MFS transporter, ACS family, D-galactonate transporter
VAGGDGQIGNNEIGIRIMANTTTSMNPVNSESASVRWPIIGILSVGMIIAYVSRSALSVPLAMPAFIKTFHLSVTDRGILNSAFFWTYAVLQIPAGFIVDRYGIKFPYFLGFAIWCLASASTALTQSIPQLILVQVLLGVGQAVVVPASYRWIRHHFVEKERGLAIALYMTGTKIGPAIGTPLAAFLIGIYDWRVMFVLIGLGGLIWLIPWLMFVKNDDRQIEQAAVKKDGTKPIPFGRILASPVTWGTIVASFCYMYFVYFCMTWMPAYFMERRHLSLGKMGLFVFFSFGGMAIVATLSGWSADLLIGRGYNPVTVRKCFTIAGFSIACTELIGARATSLETALLFAVISLSGLGLATANYWALTQTLIPGAAIGRISGIQNCACSFAGIVAPILTGGLLQRTGNYETPMMALLCVLVLGVLSYLILVREKYAPTAGPAGGEKKDRPEMPLGAPMTAGPRNI